MRSRSAHLLPHRHVEEFRLGSARLLVIANRIDAPAERRSKLQRLRHTDELYALGFQLMDDAIILAAETADWILPHVIGRPLALVRCPSGVGHDCFFQKHSWSVIQHRTGTPLPIRRNAR
jgi:hypothetical protein